ncbi:multidrug resistance protein MdtN [Kaistia sp. 32K]|uniref:multidrug transporter subunit MdtN n=1 Tax=Kaistia sp. 32K TaxID=2795690 RepID=UPI0019160DEF|nr:multidrug transporter subunit MdtN [Kaistia sp. 32K]BCP51488.1 multidrug resistance protein MdtN [Kaistia sp. 32K]
MGKPGILGKALGGVIGLAIVGGAVALGWKYLQEGELNPMSEDAVVQANLINISSTVPGRIIQIAVKDNERVKRGDLLFAIDPVPYRLAVEQATADLGIAEAALSTQERTIRAETSNAAIAVEQASRAQVNLELATQTLDRLTALRPKGYVTAQQVDDAATAKRDAAISLKQAIAQREAAEALVSTADGADALVQARKAALALAERNLADTEVRSPHDGLVVGLNVSTGEFVITGQSVFTLIDTEQWFVTAAFRETELKRIEVGACATSYVMANQSIPIRGRVVGIGWGVSSGEVLPIPRSLPYVPKTLNWVRISQRFPVRILLDNPPENLMRAGASALATIHSAERC